MKSRKPHIAVFFGGAAGSHDLSYQTGELVCYWLPRETYRVIPVHVTPEGAWQVPLGHLPQRGPVSHMLANLWRTVAAVPPVQGLERLLRRPLHSVITLLRGRGGDGGELHGLAGSMGIPVAGSPLTACQQTSDKHVCALRLSDIAVAPLARRYRQGTAVADVVADARDFLVPPLFVKPARQESSVGVMEILDAHQLGAALSGIITEDDVLVQQRSQGTELSLTLFDDAQGKIHALPPTIIHPKTARYFDHLAKRRAGRVELVCDRSADSDVLAEAEALARDVYADIGCRGLVSFDMVAGTEDSLELLDVNTVPTLSARTPLLQQLRAGGAHPGVLYDELIRRSL